MTNIRSPPKAKLVLLGSATGTIGAAYMSSKMKTEEGDDLTFEIWDTAGQERYSAISHMYYRGAQAAIVVYDITNAKSFQRAKTWVKTLRRDVRNILICICGNKCDLNEERKVRTDVVHKYSEDMNLLFFEASAKDDINIKKMFQKIGNVIHRRLTNPDVYSDISSGVVVTDFTNRGGGEGGCTGCNMNS